MSVTEAGDHINDADEPDRKEEYTAKRQRLIELIIEQGPEYRISWKDFEAKEEVVVGDSSGEKRWRPGCLYRKDVFERTFNKAERKKMHFQYEDIEDEVTGVTDQYARVYDQEDGVMRFEQFTQKKLSHNRTTNDGSLAMDKDEVKRNYQAQAKQNFRQRGYGKGMTAAELRDRSGKPT